MDKASRGRCPNRWSLRPTAPARCSIPSGRPCRPDGCPFTPPVLPLSPHVVLAPSPALLSIAAGIVFRRQRPCPLLPAWATKSDHPRPLLPGRVTADALHRRAAVAARLRLCRRSEGPGPALSRRAIADALNSRRARVSAAAPRRRAPPPRPAAPAWPPLRSPGPDVACASTATDAAAADVRRGRLTLPHTPRRT